MASNLRVSHLNIKKKKLNYFREVQSELKKITWTTKFELIAFTKIVLSTTLIFGFLIYLADLFIRNIFLLINVIFRWIA